MQEIKEEKNIKKAEQKSNIDKTVKLFFLLLTSVCAAVIIVVMAFIIYKGVMPFIKSYTENGNTGTASLSYFLTGLRFQNGFDSTTGQFLYGVGFLVVNTLFLNLLAAIISVPTSILTSLFIARIAPSFLAKIIQSGIDLLAAIPSVIYGVFGIGVIVPMVKSIARNVFQISSASGISLLSGAIILALMSIPTMISVSVTSLKSVNEEMVKGSLALGASKTQTNFKICLRSAKSGIFAGIILGIGRALGEATAISMVCGSPTYGITTNIFNPTVTLTSQMLLALGEAVTDSLNYDIRFSAGIVLMLIILISNLILNDVKDHVSAINKKPLMITRFVLYTSNLFKKLSQKFKGLKDSSNELIR
ncbi:MAG: phosphate ABC transporter permease subunit PstC [Bacilli bacterium]|jgi:phosphate transport system permease protein